MITQNEISSLNLSPTKKDFVQIWNELIEVASKITERWDPTSTNESDPGIVLLKVLTGIADKLNYNIDKNILEAYMPTAAQMESMRKLCELVGYDIKYYQSAETKVRISYTGNTNDEEERLPPSGLALPKFTTITNADKDITFVTTNTIPLLITNDTPWVEVPCIEGQISQCESTNENNLITLAQLDDDNKYYLPEIQIAENGIFVYNAITTSDGALADSTPWMRVTNLNTQPAETRVFKFGYDSFEGRPYLAFPADIGSLIGDGLLIYFVRTSGLSGNISPRTLEVLEPPSGDGWSDYSAEQFEVVNVDATINGANIENISAAYNNFKKTVGTFDTLVTCRDYMNKIYSLMDASNSPYVSNILVTDIRNDINNAITLCSCDEYGILYKEIPITKSVYNSASVWVDRTGVNEFQFKANTSNSVAEVPLIDHFDLLLYPFKTFTQVSSGTKDLVTPYNKSFTYTEQMNREIEASLADLKTYAHNLTTPANGDIIAINNYLRLNALIATSTKVSEAEAESILQNVKVALVNEFNLRNLDFGEEIPFDSILSVIENADPRIKVVSLQEPTLLTTYSVKANSSSGATSSEYGIASYAPSGELMKIDGVNYTRLEKNEDGVEEEKDCQTAKGETAKDIYNKLVLRNILAGRASLFDYDETFIPNNSEKPYTATKDITSELAAKPGSDSIASTIKAAVDTLLNASDTTVGEYILYDGTGLRIKNGLYSNNSILTVKLSAKSDSAISQDPPDTDPVSISGTELEDTLLPEVSPLSAGTSIHTTSNVVTGQLFDYKIFETYEPSFNSEGIVAAANTARSGPTSASNGIIKDVKRVEAVCEIHNADNTFSNIKLDKNEVIKFRAPNLITTKTFPAYVYYHFERANSKANISLKDDLADGKADGSIEGSYAECRSLNSFITNTTGGAPSFFTELWAIAGESKLHTVIAKKDDGTGIGITGDTLTNIFNTSIAVGVKPDVELQVKKVDPVTKEPVLEGGKQVYEPYPHKLFTRVAEFTRVLEEHFSSDDYDGSPIEFHYYPLYGGTIDIWSECVRSFKADLPAGTTLWRLSTTSGHPKGKLVTESGQRLYAQSGDYLLNSRVGDSTYICTNLGKNPDFYSMSENSDIELKKGDKLYIHYTPSSTDAEGNTTTAAEPISIVYEGGDAKNPVILKPSGFALVPSDDVNRQGTSWKKTDVDFGSHGTKNLLALAPNEQIELRSISKVVLNTTARFYKNFDNLVLESGNPNEEINYELKDGEYIFYTDRNTQEAAYYGSGSVITLSRGAFIPRAKEPIEVSQILEQGLHIIPWSDDILLTNDRTVTITEYQYVTLVAGDTLDTLTVDQSAGSVAGGYTIDSTNWTKCLSTDDYPIIYTPAGSETSVTLPRIALTSGPSTSWEVCSFLELSTSPGYAQPLRMVDSSFTEADDGTGSTPPPSTVKIKNKIKVYTSDNATSTPSVTIEPATPKDPVSVKLSTIAQTASGSFEKTDSDLDDGVDDSTMQMKVFKEEAPKFIELNTLEETVTPISNKPYSQADMTNTNLNNHWTKLEVSSQLSKPAADASAVARPSALTLNFMVPEDAESDVFGIFSIYLDVPKDKLPEAGNSDIPKEGSRIFIDIPKEFGSFTQQTGTNNVNNALNNDSNSAIISIFNCKTPGIKEEGGRQDCLWWTEGVDDDTSNRLYLRAGLNCIRVNNSCSLLIKAEADATGSLLYDNLRLVKGRATHGINLKLLNPDTTFNVLPESTNEQKVEKQGKAVEYANKILEKLADLDKHLDFYYNVPVENSLAIEFDKNIDSFSNPQTLYDINNVNNDFVISKLDVKYLKDGLKIAKSSKY